MMQPASSDPQPTRPRLAPGRGKRPTPIPISLGTRNLLVLGVIALFGLGVWFAPVVLVVALGGFAIALVLSGPVRLMVRVMPRTLAVALSFGILLAVVLAAAYVLVPLAVGQLGALVEALPALVDRLERVLGRILARIDDAGFLDRPPEAIAAGLGDRLTDELAALAGTLVDDTLGLVIGTVTFTVTLFGALIVAAMLLASARDIKAAYLMAAPARYRFDARRLWDDLADALTRYLGGLGLVLAIQGGVSAVALWLIGVPYPLALGAWVSITAVIPFIGAWIGGVPAVLVAFSVSPTAVVLTIIAFVAIQQLEGNILTPRIQGQTIRVPSVIVFLGVLAGGALFGLLGVLFAVPALAVLRVVVDFLHARLRVAPATHRVVLGRPSRPVAIERT